MSHSFSVEELRVREDLHKLRFIMDNGRWEHGSANAYMNLSAGKQLLRFVRGRGYKAPVLASEYFLRTIV